MSLALVQARAAVGIDAPRVDVEVHLGGGLPSLSIVGLPNTAVREARDRVRGALTTSGFDFPRRRITVNLAPADLPKDGARFDLAIALGILVASGQLPRERLDNTVFCAELALSGGLRPVSGTLPVALRCAADGESLVVAGTNGAEAALAGGEVYGGNHLVDVCRHLTAERPLPAARPDPPLNPCQQPDLRDVISQSHARRALEIAAAGGHSLLLSGPPGSGKSLMAARLPGLLPLMTDAEAMESASLHSIARGRFDPRDWGQRPFRSPHHSASPRALTGGGARPRPGEISLAHHGVLFLDELPEFPREALEALREPLETAEISISRSGAQIRFPARFQLVAAMNPCPCGYYGEADHDCRCTPQQVRHYSNRISGPLLDRIDLQVNVPRLTAAELDEAEESEPTATVATRVQAARERQIERDGCAATHLPVSVMRRNARLDPAGQALMKHAAQRFVMSARGWHRCWRIARTIADLEGTTAIREYHVSEALSYRERVRSGHPRTS
ncbi:YifB family Mg chelatase-like AAA ATPase [Spiribacter vilamensis]|uniref:Magnesium chelatase family protein n=1 Tax=Spiribacter vilamensis TaxID=531306 RepID=A0A4Q8D1W7_9GAMM|nr:YifB family Mg chelatase-like AAA ATPase [Spiribacter vilamensis]RZU99302.1 magnesium chelatase family protein [Spiribacter vilamensis]TVO61714.1 YifB family Mg chelatase-like AAA ATPase [Spiribacter vilamensis]